MRAAEQAGSANVVRDRIRQLLASAGNSMVSKILGRELGGP